MKFIGLKPSNLRKQIEELVNQYDIFHKDDVCNCKRDVSRELLSLFSQTMEEVIGPNKTCEECGEESCNWEHNSALEEARQRLAKIVK